MAVVLGESVIQPEVVWRPFSNVFYTENFSSLDLRFWLPDSRAIRKVRAECSNKKAAAPVCRGTGKQGVGG